MRVIAVAEMLPRFCLISMHILTRLASIFPSPNASRLLSLLTPF